jgi:hypothetical protein
VLLLLPSDLRKTAFAQLPEWSLPSIERPPTFWLAVWALNQASTLADMPRLLHSKTFTRDALSMS